MKILKNINTIDDYIALYHADMQEILFELKDTIKKAAPEAEEQISYQMPAFTQKGILVYFAAQSKHIGFYPGASGILAFKEELSEFDTSKGTVRFPYDKPLPLNLITEIVKFRVMENLEKDALRKKKNK